MHKIDGPGNVAGQFIDEDPENEIPGTQVTSKWLNTMQEEVANVVTAMGLTLDDTQNNQLLQAITRMVAGTDLIVRYTTTANIALTGLGLQTGGDWPSDLTVGDFILVKNQTVSQDNGWYLAAGGTWPRVSYLDSSAEITPGKLTKVTEGLANADSMWMLTTDGPIVLNASPLIFERKDSYNGIRYFASGTSLPSTNIGPIWHEDFNSIMTVQSFTANGAAYVGYASLNIGSILADTQPTPRPGYIKSGSLTLNRVTYAALRGWAMHHGLMVASGVWAAGNLAVSDNIDGTTFRIFDVRSEFPRFFDDSRGVDTGRVFGSWQKGTLVPIDTPVAAVWGITANVDGQPSQPLAGVDDYTASNYTGMTLTGVGSGVTSVALKGDAEGWSGVARPNNVPFLATVKF
jgi:phage-related tail fiber protein